MRRSASWAEREAARMAAGRSALPWKPCLPCEHGGADCECLPCDVCRDHPATFCMEGATYLFICDACSYRMQSTMNDITQAILARQVCPDCGPQCGCGRRL